MLMATFLETHTQRWNLCTVPPGAFKSSLDHSTSMLVCGMWDSSLSNHHLPGHIMTTQTVWATVLYTHFIAIIYTRIHDK
jgi:hypothetical protein